MSIKIYLFKTNPVNISNLAVSLFVTSTAGHVVDCCDYFLSDKFIGSTPGKFYDKCKSYSNNGFRNIDWKNLTNLLKSETASFTTDQFLVFGNHQTDQIKLLKQVFDDEIYTIGITYSKEQYPSLIKNMVEYHVHLLTNKLIVANDIDLIMLTKSSAEQIDYYSAEFDKMQLIEPSSTSQCDYNISIEDFYHKDRMLAHYNNLGWPLTTEAEQFYDNWLAAVSSDSKNVFSLSASTTLANSASVITSP